MMLIPTRLPDTFLPSSPLVPTRVAGALPSAGAVILPTDIAGLQLWLKADAGTFQDAAFTTPAVLDTDLVGGWQDQSGNANHAAQATAANKPLLKLNIQNGKPVIRYDGSNDFLSLGTILNSVLAPLKAWTVFWVGSATNTANGTMLSNADWNSPWNGVDIKAGTDSGMILMDSNGNSPVKTHRLTGTLGSGFMVVAITYSGGATMGTSDTTCKNGSDISPAKASNETITSVSIVVNLQLGARSGANQPLNGDQAEILIYNSLLSATNRQSVESYLNSRYAIW